MSVSKDPINCFTLSPASFQVRGEETTGSILTVAYLKGGNKCVWSLSGMMVARGKLILCKSAPLLLSLPQISHRLSWYWTWAVVNYHCIWYWWQKLSYF